MDRGTFADSTNWSASPEVDRLASDVGQKPLPYRTWAHQNKSRFGSRPPALERSRPPQMHATLPHFLLCTESIRHGRSAPRWKFVLQSVDGNERLSAADSEFESRRSRLELLAVVRGLEAIDRPSRVTLLTRSRYVSRGIRRQLSQWREHHWQWERFGKLVPIRDQDLWQRVDRALEFHTVDCCSWHVEDHATKLHFAARPACWQSRNGLASSIPAAFVAAVLAILRRGVLTPFSAIWRPTFTQAA